MLPPATLRNGRTPSSTFSMFSTCMRLYTHIFFVMEKEKRKGALRVSAEDVERAPSVTQAINSTTYRFVRVLGLAERNTAATSYEMRSFKFVVPNAWGEGGGYQHNVATRGTQSPPSPLTCCKPPFESRVRSQAQQGGWGVEPTSAYLTVRTKRKVVHESKK